MATPIQACRICGNSRLEAILNLGVQAFTGIFPRPGQPIGAGPLEFVKCVAENGADACGLVQLKHNYDPHALYGSHYGYRSSLNQSMVRHLNGIVQRVKSIVPLEPGDLVLDIGSNDATTLGLYERDDLDLVGIDACGDKFAAYYPPHIRLIPDFFSAAKVREHVGDRKARVITSIAMFYDLEAPLDFVREVRDLLADDGIWIAEQSYTPTMIANTSYDTICHEHLEYYAMRQIHWMTERAGLKILDVVMTNANGGSFQVIAARKEAPYPENTERVSRLLAKEEALGFDAMNVYHRFRDRVMSHRDELIHFLDDSRRRGEKIFGYGASTKGNVILQFCGLTAEHIPCFAEVNEEKFGCVTPGTNIPIVSEQEAHANRPDGFLVMPWHFRDAIVNREAAYLARGGKLVFPLPTIAVEGKRSDLRAA